MAALQQQKGRHPAIRLVGLDDGYQPIPALTNTISLVEEEQVFALFGYVGTPTTLRVQPLLKRYEHLPLTLLFPFTGAQALREGPYTKHIWHLRASYQDETRALVDSLVQNGHGRFAVYYQADSFGRSGLDGVREALARHGLQLHAEVAYRRGDSVDKDYGNTVHVLVPDRTQAPDTIICIGSSSPTAGFVRDVRAAGLNAVIATLSFVDVDTLLHLLLTEERRTGLSLTGRIFSSQVLPSYEDTTLPAVRAYRDAMDRLIAPTPAGVKSEGYTPMRYSMVGLEGYVAATVLQEAILRMGGTVTRAGLVATMETMHDFDAGLGTSLHFSPISRQGLKDVYFTVYENGRVISLSTWSGLTP